MAKRKAAGAKGKPARQAKAKPARQAKTTGVHRRRGASAPARPRAARKPGPRSQALPGFEQIRNVRLDNLCEGIHEHRRVMNAARVDEQSDIAGALQEMQRKGVSVYRHGGVELARVPGAEKLRVRVTKEEGDADASDLEAAEAVVGEDDAGNDEVADLGEAETGEQFH